MQKPIRTSYSLLQTCITSVFSFFHRISKNENQGEFETAPGPQKEEDLPQPEEEDDLSQHVGELPQQEEEPTPQPTDQETEASLKTGDNMGESSKEEVSEFREKSE